MIYTVNTRKAMKIAFEAHNKQVDKAGVPYVYHPIHLAEQMETEEECIVALLHDTVEDTDITFEFLETQFEKNIIQALKLLTHENKLNNIEYIEYIEKIKSNPIAKKVKLADLYHNSDETRKNEITLEDKKRNQKYHKAIEILSNWGNK